MVLGHLVSSPLKDYGAMEELQSDSEITAGKCQMEKFVVAYAKITTDKEGIALQGVYYGGMGDTITEAEELARECVNRIRGGTILPKVLKIESKGKILDALYDATERFEQTTANMQEADKIISRTQNRGKK